MDINIFLDQLAESQHVLTYSLYLQFKKGESDATPIINAPSSEWLEDVSKRTLDCCKVLINNGNPNFWNLSPKPIRNDLSILSSYVHFESFWKPMLQHHGIISAFVKLRKLIGNSNQLTSYGALLYSNFFKEVYHCGLDYLIANNGLKLESIEDGTVSIIKSGKKKDRPRTNQTDIYHHSSSYGNSIICFSKTIRTFSNLSIDNLEPPYTEKLVNPSNYRFPAHFLEFNDLLKGNSKFLKSILYSYKVDSPNLTRTQYKDYKTAYEELFKLLDSCKYSLSDKLYLKYQLEYYFNFDMINCLYQNINRIKETPFNYDMTTQSDLDVLSSCFLLPNVFSRQYLIQMAFDVLKNDYDIEESFFSTYKENVDVVVSKVNSTRHTYSNLTKASSWKDLYSQFIQYLSAFFFPIYESAFFIILFNDLKLSYPEKNDAERLAELYLILSKYLSQEEVYKDIFSIDTRIIASENKNISRKGTKIPLSETLDESSDETSEQSLKEPFPKECIIHPTLDLPCSESNLEAAFYGRCLKAANKQSTCTRAPDFVSLDYLKSLVVRPDERIQAYYVVESSIV